MMASSGTTVLNTATGVDASDVHIAAAATPRGVRREPTSSEREVGDGESSRHADGPGPPMRLRRSSRVAGAPSDALEMESVDAFAQVVQQNEEAIKPVEERVGRRRSMEQAASGESDGYGTTQRARTLVLTEDISSHTSPRLQSC